MPVCGTPTLLDGHHASLGFFAILLCIIFHWLYQQLLVHKSYTESWVCVQCIASCPCFVSTVTQQLGVNSTFTQAQACLSPIAHSLVAVHLISYSGLLNLNVILPTDYWISISESLDLCLMTMASTTTSDVRSTPAADLQSLQSNRLANRAVIDANAAKAGFRKSSKEAGRPHSGLQTPSPIARRPQSSRRLRALDLRTTPLHTPTLILSTPSGSPGAGSYPTPPPSAVSGTFPYTSAPVPRRPRQPCLPGDSSISASSSSSGESLDVNSKGYVSANIDLGRAFAANPEDDCDENEIEEEDPFHFDRTPLDSGSSRSQTLRKQPSRLAQTLLHRASIAPAPSTSASSSASTDHPHRFSIVRTELSTGERVFIQELSDKEGRRWSLCVPADGLPTDMVHMLDELEGLARELEQVLPKIVVTQSEQSLGPVAEYTQDVSPKITLPGAEVGIPKSRKELDGWDSLTARRGEQPSGYYLTGRKTSRSQPGHAGETLDTPSPPGLEPKPVAQSTLTRPSVSLACIPSDPSLECIYLPDFVPDGSPRLPVAEPTGGYHSPKPLTTPSKHTPAAPGPYLHARDNPRNAAFFAAVRNADSPTSPPLPYKLFSSRATPTAAPTPSPTPPRALSSYKPSSIFSHKSQVPIPRRPCTAPDTPSAPKTSIPYPTTRSVSATEPSATVSPASFVKSPRQVSDPGPPSRLPALKRVQPPDAHNGRTVPPATRSKGLLDGLPHALRTRASRANLAHAFTRSAPEREPATGITKPPARGASDQLPSGSGSGSGFKAFFRRASSPAARTGSIVRQEGIHRDEEEEHEDVNGSGVGCGGAQAAPDGFGEEFAEETQMIWGIVDFARSRWELGDD
ncbi:hypothetical protein OF83DRAFT_1287922 [Amylostereum chailletii]|nr:hypothetical protein OF83DRAFT_1287922 [Amylostereum chailletii]